MALYDEPVNAFVAGFVGTMNLLPVTVLAADAAGVTVAMAADIGAGAFAAARTGRAASAAKATDALGPPAEQARLRLPAPGALPVGTAAGALAQLGCRPHTLRVQAPDAPRDPAWGWLPGVVEASEFLGEFTRYRVRAVDPATGALWADLPHRAGQARLPSGAAVAIGLDPAQARLLPR